MCKYITFGEYNKNYKYIILTVVFSFLSSCFYGLFDILSHYNIISNKATSLIEQHSNFRRNIIFFFMAIFSFFIFKCENKLSKGELNGDKLNYSISEKGCFKSIKLIEKKKINVKKNLLNIIIIVIISIIFEFLARIISILRLNICDYFIFILLIAPFITSKMFKITIYKHQKCAIIFNIVVILIFELCSYILYMKSKGKTDENIYKFILIGFLIDITIGFILTYVYSKIKWFMHFNFISLAKLFMIFTLEQFSIYTIICLISTFIECGEKAKITICNIQKDNNYYFENISIFFEKISMIFRENKPDFIFIICLLIFEIIFAILYVLFFLSILKNLYPEHYYLSISIISILLESFNIFENRICKGYYFAKNEKDNELYFKRFLLNFIGYCLTIIGFLIYLEIIELNFCGFNYNLRKKIIERSVEDMIQEINYDDEQNESLIDDKNPNKISELSNNS